MREPALRFNCENQRPRFIVTRNDPLRVFFFCRGFFVGEKGMTGKDSWRKAVDTCRGMAIEIIKPTHRAIAKMWLERA